MIYQWNFQVNHVKSITQRYAFFRPQKLPHFSDFYYKHGQKRQIEDEYGHNVTSMNISEF